jgi:hypothetical protein
MTKFLPSLAISLGILALPVHQSVAQQRQNSPDQASQGDPSSAPDSSPLILAQGATPSVAAPKGCTGNVDPYANYACLDTYLGDDVFSRFINYYKLEWGQAGPPVDPNAPSSHRAGWPATPMTTPPMPFTEWPYGGTTPLGVTLPNSVDSPLMVAIANTALGQWMNDNHFQVYGWIDPGINLSSNTVRPGGNAPISYIYTPNTVQLDQFVVYLDRFPDTVQTDHIDWGLRLSAIYGENYRYTTSYGLASYQLLKDNKVNGYDFPMLYGELYIPYLAEGLLLRAGRFISLPDIEAQLAPNNYMYTHSMTYAFDNYTNEGVQATLAVTKDLMLQAGVSVGTEATVSHLYQNVPNPAPNAIFPGKYFPKDPGAVPSFTACFRYTWNEGNDNIYPCADAINSGTWGYNNIQWYGATYYHKFDDNWHISMEGYDIHSNHVPNLNNPRLQPGGDIYNAFAAGGSPFSPVNMPYNAPNMASCHNTTSLTCRAEAIGLVAYLNYSPDPLNNFSFRPEFYDDMQGWRTGTRAVYVNFGLGWQHWLSPQIEFRPEVDWDRSNGAKAFNGNSNAGIPGDKNYTILAAADVIIHF